MADNILIKLNDTETNAELKSVFGLPNVTHSDDFMATVAGGVTSWQGKNWDPQQNDASFDIFCSNITSDAIIYSQTEGLTKRVQGLLEKGGYKTEVSVLTTPLLNWIGWLDLATVKRCKVSQEQCFGQRNTTFYQQDDIRQQWRSWPYQVSKYPLYPFIKLT